MRLGQNNVNEIDDDVIRQEIPKGETSSEESKSKTSKKAGSIVSDDNLKDDETIKLDEIKAIETETGVKIDRTHDQNTRDRRCHPMLASSYEDENNSFYPAYSLQQLAEKAHHAGEVLAIRGEMSISDFNGLTEKQQIAKNFAIAEETVNDPTTLFYHNATRLVVGQSRRAHSEPVSVAIKYDPKGEGFAHAVVFERQPAYNLNAFITEHFLGKKQEAKFNATISKGDGPIIGSDKPKIVITKPPKIDSTSVNEPAKSDSPSPTTTSTGNLVTIFNKII